MCNNQDLSATDSVYMLCIDHMSLLELEIIFYLAIVDQAQTVYLLSSLPTYMCHNIIIIYCYYTQCTMYIVASFESQYIHCINITLKFLQPFLFRSM